MSFNRHEKSSIGPSSAFSPETLEKAVSVIHYLTERDLAFYQELASSDISPDGWEAIRVAVSVHWIYIFCSIAHTSKGLGKSFEAKTFETELRELYRKKNTVLDLLTKEIYTYTREKPHSNIIESIDYMENLLLWPAVKISEVFKKTENSELFREIFAYTVETHQLVVGPLSDLIFHGQLEDLLLLPNFK